MFANPPPCLVLYTFDGINFWSALDYKMTGNVVGEKCCGFEFDYGETGGCKELFPDNAGTGSRVDRRRSKKYRGASSHKTDDVENATTINDADVMNSKEKKMMVI